MCVKNRTAKYQGPRNKLQTQNMIKSPTRNLKKRTYQKLQQLNKETSKNHLKTSNKTSKYIKPSDQKNIKHLAKTSRVQEKEQTNIGQPQSDSHLWHLPAPCWRLASNAQKKRLRSVFYTCTLFEESSAFSSGK